MAAEGPDESNEAIALQGASLLIRSTGGAWSVPRTTTWDDERSLQTIVAENPTILPGVADPRALAVTEFRIPGVGSLDVLCVEPDGTLTLCEAKLKRNPQIRREVVGQILAYASGLEQMTLGELSAAWTTRAGSSLTSTMVGDDADLDEVSAFEASVSARLAEGRFRLVLAVDELTEELRATISYLSRHTTGEFQLIALELAYASRDGVEVLVPRTWGAEATAAGPARPNRGASVRGGQVPPRDVATVAGACGSEAAGFIVTELVTRLAPHLAYLFLGDPEHIAEVGCVLIVDEPARCHPIAVRPGQRNPGLRLCFGWMHRLGTDRLEELLLRLVAHPGLAEALAGVRDGGFKSRPMLTFELLSDPVALELLVSALNEVLRPFPH